MMKKNTGFLLTPLIWTAFVALVGGIFWKIFVTDASAGTDTSLFTVGIPLVVVLVFIVLSVVEYGKVKERIARYAAFEQLFPELPGGVTALPEKADFYQEFYLAVYKGYFISNWEFDFIDLDTVASIYYERTAAVKRRGQAIVGDDPQLVFITKSDEKRTVKLGPGAPVKDVSPVLAYIAGIAPEIRYGLDKVSFEDYCPILEELR